MISMHYVAVTAITIGFTFFDLALFPLTITDGVANRWRVPYRILQAAVQLGLYALAWWTCSWGTAAAAAFLWWAGGCDVMYYVLGGYNLRAENTWTWLWWTPVGMIRWTQGWRAPAPLMSADEVIRQAVVGLLGAVLLALF